MLLRDWGGCVVCLVWKRECVVKLSSLSFSQTHIQLNKLITEALAHTRQLLDLTASFKTVTSKWYSSFKLNFIRNHAVLMHLVLQNWLQSCKTKSTFTITIQMYILYLDIWPKIKIIIKKLSHYWHETCHDSSWCAFLDASYCTAVNWNFSLTHILGVFVLASKSTVCTVTLI